MPMLFAQVSWALWLVPVAGVFTAGLVAWFGLRWFQHAPQRRADQSWRGPERRIHRRASVSRVTVLIREVEPPQEPQPGLILDRSLGGLGLEVSQEMAVGRHLQFRLPSWAPTAPWVTAEVRYCQRHGMAWRVGCRFLDASAWEVLNLFGPPDPDEAAP
jgi:hypothetical protein